MLDDPEQLARFVSFVNAPETPDPSISSSPSAASRAARALLAGPAGRRTRAEVCAQSRLRPRGRPAGESWSPVCRLRRPAARSAGSRRCSATQQVALFRTVRRRAVRGGQPRPVHRRAGAVPRASSAAAGDTPTVASPLHKQVFDLRTGGAWTTSGSRAGLPRACPRRCRRGVRAGRWPQRSDDRPLHVAIEPLAGYTVGDHRGPAARGVRRRAGTPRRQGRVRARRSGSCRWPTTPSCCDATERCLAAPARLRRRHDRHRVPRLDGGRRRLGPGRRAHRASARPPCSPAAPRRAARSARAACARTWSPESESSSEVLEHLIASYDLDGMRIAVQLHGEPLPDVVRDAARSPAPRSSRCRSTAGCRRRTTRRCAGCSRPSAAARGRRGRLHQRPGGRQLPADGRRAGLRRRRPRRAARPGASRPASAR